MKISKAQEIKNNIKMIDMLTVADDLSTNADQDWDNAETTFMFSDGSRLLVGWDYSEVL